MAHPHSQELNPSARFVRGDMEETSRLAAVKLSQASGGGDTSSASSVAFRSTPEPARAARAAKTEGASATPAGGFAMPRVKRDITHIIGDTPCIFLSEKTTAGCVATVLAKLESNEPCCSVKDRCAWRGCVHAAAMLLHCDALFGFMLVRHRRARV